jgi:multicomponent Na+:H+ antiporter subunit D
MSPVDVSRLPLIALGAPLVAALLALLGPRRWVAAWGGAAAVVSAAACAALLPAVRAGAPVEAILLTLVPGLDLVFRVDALGLTFALLAAGLWTVTSVYAAGYASADKLKHRPRFFAAFAASIGAAVGVAFAGNLLTFFLFYELLTLATYPLVVHKETERAFAAGRRYLLFALGGGLALLTAVAWTWQLTGTLDFRAGGFIPPATAPAVLAGLLALFAGGVAVKSAVMPLHAWLPNAMVAPTPVSALLHAVAVVKAGVFGAMRVVGFVFGPETLAAFRGIEVVAVLAAATILAGSVIALRQDNLKRRLAYSTIVHLSYIVLGAALVSAPALTGSVLHMVNHGLAKITLFFCAGAIYVTSHRENVSDLAGMGRRMPWTFGAFTVASLALIGIPGLSGFTGKFFLARGAIAAGDPAALAVMLGASLFTAADLLPIVRIAYLPGAPGQGAVGARREAPAAMVVPLVVTAVFAAAFGFLPLVVDVQYGLADAVAASVFGTVR